MSVGQPNLVLHAHEFRRVQEMIYAEAGIRLPEGKQALVQNRLARHLERMGLPSYAAYLDLLASPRGAEEKLLFVDSLTTNETFFFRHRQHWDFFTRTFITEAKASLSQGEPLRVWSAAASTGCEAYSAAIALEESLPSRQWNWEVEGTDLSRKVLEHAGAGLYDDYALQKVTDYALNRYFLPEGSNQRVKPALRAKVRFLRHNLLEPRAGSRFHLIFLRNVLFYFDEASRSEVVRQVLPCLMRGGYLILGGAETLPEDARDLRVISPGIYRKG